MIEVEGWSGAALARLEDEWRVLHDRVDDATPFQSWEWLSSYWSEAGNGHPWILCARESGRLVGVLPLVVQRYRGLPIRRLGFLGAPLSDYQDLLALPEHRDACRDAFLAHVEEQGPKWDLLDLADVPVESALTRMSTRPGRRLAVTHHRVCPYVPLPSSWEAYRASLSGKLRRGLGRDRRKLERELSARFERVDERYAPETLEALFELHDRRWQRRGLSGAFADEEVRRVHRRVVPLFLERGWLRLYRMVTGDRIRGVFYCFQRAGRLYYYVSGFDLELERFSVGTVLLGHVIERAIDEGARELDFLRGDENYKYAWGAIDRRTVRLVMTKPTWRSSAGLGVNRLERELDKLGTRLRNRLWGHARRRAAG
jgi:CelD/BcsL family acetyltransferase involved in cellulose biosynthesis